MATSLNPGFTNNINVIEIRVNGAHQQRVTDRPIAGAAARTIVSAVTETDGGVSLDRNVDEFTEGS
jgi:hypothetical protein